MIRRVYGLETEYGCLPPDDRSLGTPGSIAIEARDYVFHRDRLGIVDIHHRGWDEPPGNGGFLFNAGRVYIDMGHVEYTTPECGSIFDIVAFDKAGERVLHSALQHLGLQGRAAFIKNNVDHFTGATFGCHENYLLRRDVPFSKVIIPMLLPFFATRQIFAGAGRVGYHDEIFEYHPSGDRDEGIKYQIAQRADHIVTEIYQWIQFSRAIINTRDEPLADYTKYRRLHLLVGDSNMSEYATALKVGTTSLVLDLLEDKHIPKGVGLLDPVQAIKDISRDQSYRWLVERQNGTKIPAIEVQREYLGLAQRHLKGRDAETDWILAEWESVLEVLERDPLSLTDRVDWVTKRWLLEAFIEAEGLSWSDPWLHSLDLEYHNIDPERGLYYELERKGMTKRVVTNDRIHWAIQNPPSNTRARARGLVVRMLADKRLAHRYIIDWDSVYIEDDKYIDMKDPFDTYEREAADLFKGSKRFPFLSKPFHKDSRQ